MCFVFFSQLIYVEIMSEYSSFVQDSFFITELVGIINFYVVKGWKSLLNGITISLGYKFG